jgi:hypothetical protein
VRGKGHRFARAGCRDDHLRYVNAISGETVRQDPPGHNTQARAPRAAPVRPPLLASPPGHSQPERSLIAPDLAPATPSRPPPADPGSSPSHPATSHPARQRPYCRLHRPPNPACTAPGGNPRHQQTSGHRCGPADPYGPPNRGPCGLHVYALIGMLTRNIAGKPEAATISTRCRIWLAHSCCRVRLAARRPPCYGRW